MDDFVQFLTDNPGAFAFPPDDLPPPQEVPTLAQLIDIRVNLRQQCALRATSNRESSNNQNRTVAVSNRGPYSFCHWSCAAPHRGPTPLQIRAGHLLARGIYTALQLADPNVRFPLSQSPTPILEGRLPTPRADSDEAPPVHAPLSLSRAIGLIADRLPTPDADSNEVPVRFNFSSQVLNELVDTHSGCAASNEDSAPIH